MAQSVFGQLVCRNCNNSAGDEERVDPSRPPLVDRKKLARDMDSARHYYYTLPHPPPGLYKPGKTVRVARVRDWLFIGGSELATRSTLRKLGIAVLINCSTTPQRGQDAGVHVLDVPVRGVGTETIGKHFPRVIALLEEVNAADLRVLVHSKHVYPPK